MANAKRQDMNQTGVDLQSSEMEYAFGSVPAEKRKSLISLTAVLAGYPIALNNFVIGAKVGAGLTFKEGVLALVAGNGMLIFIVILTGLIAYRTGLTTAFLSRRAFGRIGSQIFSGLLALSAVLFLSINADMFARLTINTFAFWKLPVSITAIICLLLWMQSAIRGYGGLQIVSYIGVPAAIICAAYSVFRVGQVTDGFVGLLSYVPDVPISFATATATIVGGWVFGATITPDVCRYAKRKFDIFFAGLVAFLVGCFGLQFAGMVVAVSTGEGDFTTAITAIGLGYVAWFTAIFCLWTTNDNNIYGASLALQNILRDTKLSGRFKHKHLALFVTVVACVLAALGIYSYINVIYPYLSVFIPPVPGLLIAEEFFIKRPNTERRSNRNAIIAWICGGVVGFIALRLSFFIPPLCGMATAFVIYLVISKLFPVAQPQEQPVATVE